MQASEPCSALYCGQGECVVTERGAGCNCDQGFVARAFTDLYGEQSVTCVPEEPPVDLSLDLELPDACADVDCGTGDCVDLGGVAACGCPNNHGGVLVAGVPECWPPDWRSSSPGAENFLRDMKDIDVCSPPPPECGVDGWLERVDRDGPHGVECESSIPAPEALVVPPAPTCEDMNANGVPDEEEDGSSGNNSSSGGCTIEPEPSRGLPAMLFGFIALLGWRLRSSRRQR